MNNFMQIFDQSGLIDYVTSAKGLALKDIDEMLGKREKERRRKEGRNGGRKEMIKRVREMK